MYVRLFFLGSMLYLSMLCLPSAHASDEEPIDRSDLINTEINWGELAAANEMPLQTHALSRLRDEPAHTLEDLLKHAPEPLPAVEDISFKRQNYNTALSHGPVYGTKEEVIGEWGTIFPRLMTICKHGTELGEFYQNLHDFPELCNHSTFGNHTLLYYVIRNARAGPTLGGLNNLQTRLQMMKALIKAGAEVNLEVDLSQRTCDSLLTLACRLGDVNMVNILLSAGADIEFADDMGWTPLHHALLNPTQTQDIMNALLEHGADVHAECDNGNTALDMVEKVLDRDDTDQLSALIKFYIHKGELKNELSRKQAQLGRFYEMLEQIKGAGGKRKNRARKIQHASAIIFETGVEIASLVKRIRLKVKKQKE
jgi:hypothetical protein